MASSSVGQLSFNAGEFAPNLEGRVDFDKYPNSCKKLQNFLPQTQGPLMKRSGTRFVKEAEDSDNTARLIPFEFHTDDAYVVEFGDNVLRFYRESAAVLETAGFDLDAATSADPVVITTTSAHGWHTGDEVYIAGLTNQTKLNGRFFKITWLSTTTFSLQDFGGTDIDGTSQSADTTGAAADVDKVYEVPWVGTISDITAIGAGADGTVTTIENHGLAVGDTVWFEEILGMVELNRTAHDVKAILGPRTFTIEQATSGYGVYSMGGKVGKQLPWAAADVGSIQVAQSADVLYVAHKSHPPHKITRTGHTSWTIEKIAWLWEPFQPENIDEDDFLIATDVTGSVTLISPSGNFTSADEGKLVRFREIPEENYPQWVGGETAFMSNYQPGVGGAVGTKCHYEGRVYELLDKVGNSQTGNVPPIHTEGVRSDGKYMWSFLHHGIGYAKITAYTSANYVTATVIKELPITVSEAAQTINSITLANPAEVNVTSHGYETGDQVWIDGGGDMTEVNDRLFTVTRTGANTFTLDDEDSQLYTAYTTGGSSYLIQTGDSATITGTNDRRSQDPWRWAYGAWSDDDGYPRTVTFFEDRLWWAGSDSSPQSLWGSRTGNYEDHETDDTDESAMLWTFNTDQVNVIEWISAQRVMLVGTAGGEHIVSAASQADALTPSSVRVTQQSSYGSRAGIRAVRASNVLLFVQRAGRKVRELVYDFNSDSYEAPDLTLLAPHIALDKIKRVAFQQEPIPTVWVLMEDGELCSFIYERSADVIGWTHHLVGGTSVEVEDITVIPHEDGDRDQLWMLVKRTINGGTKRYVEYLEQDWLRSNDIEDAVFSDSSLTVSGSASALVGLDHLEGETVRVLGDGLVQDSQTVSGGSITLATAVTSKVTVGLDYEAIYRSMRFEAGKRDSSQGKTSRITRMVFRLDQTGEGLFYGPTDTDADMEEYKIDAGTLYDGDTRSLPWPSGYQQDEEGALASMKHKSPTPCQVTAVLPQIESMGR